MKRVLIVDDSIELGRTLQDALKLTNPGIPITVVPSAEEALLESTRYTIDLLVTDLRLPGMSGLDLIRKIRVRQPNIKVMLITGMVMDERLTKQKDELHPDAFMRKPISATAFLDTVDALFGKVKAAPEEAQAAPEKAQAAPEKPQTAQSLGAASERSGSASPAEPALEKKPSASEPAAPANAGPEDEKAALLRELAGVMPGDPVEPKPEPKRSTGRLGGTGRLEAAPEAAPRPEDTGLSGILSRLRSSFGALSAMLIDERGHSVAQAGDLPDMKLETYIIPPLMASLSAAAKVSFQIGEPSTGALPIAQTVQAFKGGDVDLVVAPVGQYLLMIALKPSRSTLRLAVAFEEALNAQGELMTVLESMGLHVQSLVEAGAPAGLLAEMGTEEGPVGEVVPPELLETPLGQDLTLEKFEALFTQKKTGQLRIEDPDAFWDTAAQVEKPETNPGMLTFEQAQKLGLLPTEGND